MTPQIQYVLFRTPRRRAIEITAVLLGQSGSPTAPLAVWDSQSGHASATYGWYATTRPATPAEYADELKKLQRQYAPEYRIEVRQRMNTVR